MPKSAARGAVVEKVPEYHTRSERPSPLTACSAMPGARSIAAVSTLGAAALVTQPPEISVSAVDRQQRATDLRAKV